MPHHKSRHIWRDLILDECRNIADNQSSGAGQSPIGLGRRAASPAALIPGEDLDPGRGEAWEEGVVAVNVLGEAMDKNELCFDRTRRLRVGSACAALCDETTKRQELTVHVLV